MGIAFLSEPVLGSFKNKQYRKGNNNLGVLIITTSRADPELAKKIKGVRTFVAIQAT